MDSAKLQMRAANASLRAVEEGINLHAQNRDYGKLKEIAEASGLAAKVGNPHRPHTCMRHGPLRAAQPSKRSRTASLVRGQGTWQSAHGAQREGCSGSMARAVPWKLLACPAMFHFHSHNISCQASDSLGWLPNI